MVTGGGRGRTWWFFATLSACHNCISWWPEGVHIGRDGEVAGGGFDDGLRRRWRNGLLWRFSYYHLQELESSLVQHLHLHCPLDVAFALFSDACFVISLLYYCFMFYCCRCHGRTSQRFLFCNSLPLVMVYLVLPAGVGVFKYKVSLLFCLFLVKASFFNLLC